MLTPCIAGSSGRVQRTPPTPADDVLADSAEHGRAYRNSHDHDGRTRVSTIAGQPEEATIRWHGSYCYVSAPNGHTQPRSRAPGNPMDVASNGTQPVGCHIRRVSLGAIPVR